MTKSHPPEAPLTTQQMGSSTSDGTAHFYSPETSSTTYVAVYVSPKRTSQIPSTGEVGIGTPASTPATPGSSTTEIVKSIQTVEPRFLRTDDWKNTVYRRSTRYHGPTSFSAIFSEHQAKLNEDLLDIGEDSRKHPGAWQFGQPLLGRERPTGPTARMTQVIKALWNIPAEEVCETLLNKALSLIRHVPMIKHCIKTLYSTFGTELAAPRSAEKFVDMSEVLFKNEERPLPQSPDDGMEWLDTFMGPNIRFEMMGMLFCFFGLAYLSLQDWDPLFELPENHGRNRKQYVFWKLPSLFFYPETLSYESREQVSEL